MGNVATYDLTKSFGSNTIVAILAINGAFITGFI